jgi:hypothetical protein
MTKTLVLLVALAGCAHKPAPGTDTDAAASHDSRASDGSSNGSDAASAYVCTPNTRIPNSCCVFETVSTCGSGSDCYYDPGADDTVDSTPSQGAGVCMTAMGPILPLNATCNAEGFPTLMSPYCGPNAWCAFDANTSPQNSYAGICRQLCDPLDTAVHGCPSPMTCVGMRYCGFTYTWPNCPQATNTHMGYCEP